MRQKRDLVTICATNEPRHTSLHRHEETIRIAAFSHSLGGERTFQKPWQSTLSTVCIKVSMAAQLLDGTPFNNRLFYIASFICMDKRTIV
jgi:hypothetical protein